MPAIELGSALDFRLRWSKHPRRAHGIGLGFELSKIVAKERELELGPVMPEQVNDDAFIGWMDGPESSLVFPAISVGYGLDFGLGAS